MADTYYAWSRFKKTVNEWGRVDEWVEPGEEVSQADLGVTDSQWQELIDVGAVRTTEYPDVADGVSPAEHYRANPDDRPETNVDETSSVEEVIAADVKGEKAPTGTEAGTGDEENKQTWQK